jgi:dienelactone hydrolase
MRYASTTFGEKPPAGRSLWISLHGGGGAPAKVNDQQWQNQARLYRPAEGIYVAPRAPTDSWNMWHQAPIDALLDRLIENLVALEEVDPNRVYLLGYSAGGDGVFQLAPRMADRWAAASMMAGHPGDARPDGLRNIGFAIHTGENDAAYERNAHAKRWKTLLAELERGDPGAYRHQVQVHAGKGHWMDRDDAVAVPWMAGFVRNPRPAKVIWVQDDVTHRRFAWLAVDEPKAGAKIVVERSGQRVRVVEAPPSTVLRIRLDDEMLDLDAEVVVTQGERELFRGVVPRTREVLERTLEERGDPRSVFSAEVVVTTAP